MEQGVEFWGEIVGGRRHQVANGHYADPNQYRHNIEPPVRGRSPYVRQQASPPEATESPERGEVAAPETVIPEGGPLLSEVGVEPVVGAMLPAEGGGFADHVDPGSLL